MTPAIMSQDSTGTASPRHIVVVDDDASFLRSMGRLLRSEGYLVSTFASGCEYLHTFSGSLPACMVLDVCMPQMTGMELHDRLTEQGMHVPAIFMTAHDTPQTRERARQPGSFGLLLKPFDKNLLFKTISEAITPQSSEEVPAPGC